MPLATYSIDTSSLVWAWEESFTPQIVPAFWVNLSDLFRSGRAVLHEEIQRELKRHSKELYKWWRTRGIRPSRINASQEQHVIDILTQHEHLVHAGTGRSGGDPWVIATALDMKGAHVVTQEKVGTLPKKPRIPDVCKTFGVRYMTMLELVKDEGWRF